MAECEVINVVLLVNIHFWELQGEVKSVQMDNIWCYSIPGMRHGAKYCEETGWQATTSALKGTCNLLRNTAEHVERENTEGGREDSVSCEGSKREPVD